MFFFKKIFVYIRKDYLKILNIINVIFSKKFPLQRILNKHFEPGHLSPHYEIINLYLQNGKAINIKETKYWDRGELFYKLPKNLDCEPIWWIMPWAYTPKENKSPSEKHEKKLKQSEKFFNLIDDVIKNGYSFYKSGPFNGYLLHHPDHGQVFIIVDGHHRLAMLSYLNNIGLGYDKIPIKIIEHYHYDYLINYPIVQKLIAGGYFTKNDAYKWFNNAYWYIESTGV